MWLVAGRRLGYCPRKAELNRSVKYFWGNLQGECLDMNFTTELAPLDSQALWTPRKHLRRPEYSDGCPQRRFP